MIKPASESASPAPGQSFQSRITIAAMMTAVVVLIAASGVFVFEQWRADRTEFLRQQQQIAHILAGSRSVQGALVDKNQAPEAVLRIRTLVPTLAAAALRDGSGRLIASYGAASPYKAGQSPLLESSAPVMVSGRQVGQLTLSGAATSITALLPRYMAVVGALFFAATGLSLFLGRWLAARVTEPVNRLSVVMGAVAASGDFSQRVERTSDDELGRLTDSFNDLLAKLHDNDQALRRMLSELMEARDAAEAANRLKSQFLANMSHEIRTPLNGLLAMTQVMAMEDLNPVQRDRLGVIRHSGETLLAILNDILDVSKIEAGKLELEFDDFDTEQLAHDTHATFAPVADKKGLGLILDVAPQAKGLRRGDAARLRQILNNLVSNALKFTQAGEVRVSLAELGAGGEDGLRLIIADTGIGISAEALPILFQKFTQADSSTTRRFGGTGLGLAICHELCQLMEGRIWVESEEGRGSTFHVEVPAPRVAASAPEPEAVEAAPEQGQEQALRVLAAEDNPTNQLVLSTVMGIFGVDLVLVENGRLAVERWNRESFDIILMDIQMPEMDGLTATRLIRAAEIETGRPRTPIIALSAHAMTHQVKEYLQAGIDLHVPKPIELPRLQAAMEEVLTLNEAASQREPAPESEAA